MTIFIGLLFPSGRVLSPRWRLVARATAAALALAYVTSTLDADPAAYNAPGAANPLRLHGFGLAVVDVLSSSLILLPLAAVAAVVALVLRTGEGTGKSVTRFGW